MSTALFELAISVPERVKELNTLIVHAQNREREDEALYNAICRAASVLLASHLEGFLKDLIGALTADLNYHLGTFSRMPAAMQRTFCERIAYYEGVGRTEIDDRIRQLVAFFKQNSVPIDMKAINYKESPNKNATSVFIDTALAKLGIPEAVNSLAGGRLDAVFDNDSRTSYVINRDLVRFRSRLYSYPYRKLPSRYGFSFRSSKSSSPSLWHVFIEDLMTRRHKVVHGDTLENETSWETLRSDTLKMEVLMQGLMYASATYLAPAK